MKERQEDGRFCRAYLRTMDPERAAAEINRRDGYTMLGRKTTQQHLEQMRSAAAATVKREDILRQLAKLAFGGAEDAVRLALERGETAPEGLELLRVRNIREAMAGAFGGIRAKSNRKGGRGQAGGPGAGAGDPVALAGRKRRGAAG